MLVEIATLPSALTLKNVEAANVPPTETKSLNVVTPVTVALPVTSIFLTLECPVVTSRFLPVIERLFVPLTVRLPATT